MAEDRGRRSAGKPLDEAWWQEEPEHGGLGDQEDAVGDMIEAQEMA